MVARKLPRVRIPDELMNLLVEQAKRNRRRVQDELLVILEAAVSGAQALSAETRPAAKTKPAARSPGRPAAPSIGRPHDECSLDEVFPLLKTGTASTFRYVHPYGPHRWQVKYTCRVTGGVIALYPFDTPLSAICGLQDHCEANGIPIYVGTTVASLQNNTFEQQALKDGFSPELAKQVQEQLDFILGVTKKTPAAKTNAHGVVWGEEDHFAPLFGGPDDDDVE